MKGPPNFSATDIVRADVTRCRSFALADARTLNEEILIRDAWARCYDEGIADVTAETDGEIYPSGIAKIGSGSTGGRVERVQSPAGGKEDPTFAALGPIRDPAVHVRFARSIREGIEAPNERASVGA